MSKPSWPRAITRASIGNGKTVASALPALPLYISASSRRCPRATVPSTSGRADRESPKNADSRSGTYFGWSCISWRHAAKNKHAATEDTKETEDTKDRKERTERRTEDRTARQRRLPSVTFVTSVSLFLIGNCGDLPGTEGCQEVARPFEIEFRVGSLDTEEEPVPARQREARHVEHRVIRLRQAVQRQHAQHRGERGDENRALEGHRDERRPTVQGLSADVH